MSGRPPVRFDRSAFRRGVDDLMTLRPLRVAIGALVAAILGHGRRR